MTEPDGARQAAPPHDTIDDAGVIETGAPLSRSRLWQIQRDYFHRVGVRAWSAATVPHYVTNNPALADAYVEVILGFWRDVHAAGAHPEEPLTIVELGSGCGRFAFLFLRALTERLSGSPLAGVRFRYVMTDFTETNVAFFQRHASLAPFVAEGVLDFAVFDATTDHEIWLCISGEVIAPGRRASPLAVIANYVFDGIPQDAFSFDGGALREYLVTLTSQETSAEPARPLDVDRLRISWTRRPASLDYYDDRAMNDVLRGYIGRVKEGATVLFPSAAIRCLVRLAELSSGRLLLVSGDRGETHEDAVGTEGEPDITVHGSFSMDVNYHAMAEYVRRLSGLALTVPYQQEHLSVAAFLLGAHPAGWIETRAAFARSLERGGPIEFFSLRRALADGYRNLDLPQLLSVIRLGHWDPRILYECGDALHEHGAQATPALSAEMVRTVMRVWERHYPIGEPKDFAFAFAMLAHAFGGIREALVLFQASRDLHGADPRTLWNMALCHMALGEVESACVRLREVAALAPGFAPAGALQPKA